MRNRDDDFQSREKEDGMGFAGLVPTAAERADEVYRQTREKIAATREKQLADAVAALQAICALDGRHDLPDAQDLARAALTKGERQ